MKYFCIIILIFLYQMIEIHNCLAQWTYVGLDGQNIRGLIAKNDYLLAGTYSNYYQGATGFVYKSLNEGNSWEIVIGDSLLPVFTMLNVNDHIILTTQGGGVFQSMDDGTNWESINNGLPEPSGFFGNYVNYIANKDDYLFAGTNDGILYYSKDFGKKWLGSNTPPPSSIYTFAFSGDTIFVGTTSGLYKSINKGVDFKIVPTSLYNSQIVAVNGKYLFVSSRIYGGSGSGFYRTTDGGKSWEKLSHGLPEEIEVYSYCNIGKSMIIGFYDLVNSKHGIFRSDDFGDSWLDISEGLPDGSGVVSYATLGENFYIGTFNKGVWVQKLSQVTSINNFETNINEIEMLHNYPNPFNPNTTIDYKISKYSFVEITIYDLLGRKIETLINERKMPGRYSLSWNGSDYASGTYFIVLKTESGVKFNKMDLLK